MPSSSAPALAPPQRFRDHPNRTTGIYIAVVTVMVLSLLGPVLVSVFGPDTRQRTAPLVVSDPRLPNDITISDRECPTDPLAVTGKGWRCQGVKLESIVTPTAGDPDRALRRLTRFISLSQLPEGEIIRENNARILIDENTNIVALSQVQTMLDEEVAAVVVVQGTAEQRTELVNSTWQAMSGTELPDPARQALGRLDAPTTESGPLPRVVHSANPAAATQEVSA